MEPDNGGKGGEGGMDIKRLFRRAYACGCVREVPGLR